MTSPITADPPVINDSAALAGGDMVIISVEAIRDQTERNWRAKQDTVWEFAQRQFEKTFPRTDAIRKLNDVDYLIAQASEEGPAAQFKAIDLLRGILTFFLGASSLSQLRLSVVRTIEEGVIDAQPLSLEQIEAVLQHQPQSTWSAEPVAMTHPPNQINLKLTGDRAYDVVVSIEPIWNVYKQAVASYHLRPLAYETLGTTPPHAHMDELSLRDALMIDLALLKTAAATIREGQGQGYSFALHVPINFRCLRSLSCRSEMARVLPLFVDIRKFMAFCVVGIPDGAPKSTLAEVISALRPYGLGVVMQADAMTDEVQRWRGLGLSAVSYDFAEDVQDGPDILKRTKDFGAICAGVGAGLFGLGVSKRPLLMAAWSAGFTHISGTPITEKMPERRAAIRFPAAQLYS